jgi:hypothetical protein
MSNTEAKPRLGYVYLNIKYPVLLDDEEMIQAAKDALYEDLTTAYKLNELYSAIDVEEDFELSESDIDDFLLEHEDDPDWMEDPHSSVERGQFDEPYDD